MTDPLAYLLSIVALLVAPGPTNALLASAGASGTRRGVILLIAPLLGYMATVAVIGFLLRPLLIGSPMLGVILKIAVALYLVAVAVRLWRSKPDTESNVNSVSWRDIFITTLLNPKGLVFALVIIPFGNPQVASCLAVFSVCIVGSSALWLLAGQVLGKLAATYRDRIPRITAVVLAGFAGLIAASALG